MSREIERRFFVRDRSILSGLTGQSITQGYLIKAPGALSTRIRVSGPHAWITLKSPRIGASRDEYEYQIPVNDAIQMIDRYCAGRVLHKIRYQIAYSDLQFEVDVFAGPLAGLVIAELELARLDVPVLLPPWIGKEITADHRYGNSSLAQCGMPENFAPSAMNTATPCL